MATDAHTDTLTEPDEDVALGARAVRTRSAILEAAQQLFLERGYAGTRINNITDACGISRAGFYTYFKDKHEVVVVLGHTVYEEILGVIGQWDDIPRPCTIEDVTAWVRTYFSFMDRHGAFIFSANQSAPMDEEFRTSSRRMQMRVAFLLGVSLRSRQSQPSEAPEALGLTTLAMLDLSWSYQRVQRLPVSLDDIVHTISSTIMHTLTGRNEP